MKIKYSLFFIFLLLTIFFNHFVSLADGELAKEDSTQLQADICSIGDPIDKLTKRDELSNKFAFFNKKKQEYELAKQQYEKVKTIQARDFQIKKAKELLLAKIDVIKVYDAYIKQYISATYSISDNIKQKYILFYENLDKIYTKFVANVKDVKTISDLSALDKKIDEFLKQHNLKTYYIISNIKKADIFFIVKKQDSIFQYLLSLDNENKSIKNFSSLEEIVRFKNQLEDELKKDPKYRPIDISKVNNNVLNADNVYESIDKNLVPIYKKVYKFETYIEQIDRFYYAK